MYITDLPAANSVKVGELWRPAKYVESAAAESVRLLTFEHDGYVGFRGSCTLFKHRGKKFVVTTRHQLGIPRGYEISSTAFDAMRIEAKNGELLANILVDTCIFEKANPDQEYHDLLIFRVAEESVQTMPQPFCFFPLFEIKNCWYRFSFCVGYPSFANSMDYDENHLRAARAIRGCVRDKEFRSSADYLMRFVDRDDGFDFDGFSGGAAFSLLETGEGCEVGLEGIIVRASRGYIHVVSSDFLRTLC